MHRAPAVSFPVTRSRWHVRAIVLLSLLALASTLAFAHGQSLYTVRTLILACATVVVGLLAVQAWRKSPAGCLRWDGAQWHWSGFAAAQACRLHLQMDFQRVLLVCVSAHAQRPIYLWLEAAADSAAWNAVRRAVVCSPSVVAGDGAGDGHNMQPDARGGAA